MLQYFVVLVKWKINGPPFNIERTWALSVNFVYKKIRKERLETRNPKPETFFGANPHPGCRSQGSGDNDRTTGDKLVGILL